MDDASCLTIKLITRSSEDVYFLPTPCVQMAKAGFAFEKITVNLGPKNILR